MMTYSKITKWLVCTSLASALSVGICAQEAELYWLRDHAKLVKTGAGSTFAIDQLGIRVAAGQWQQSPQRRQGDTGREMLTVAVSAEKTNIHWSGSGAAASSLYWLSVPLSYQQWRSSELELIAQLEPGLMLGLSDVSKDALALNAEVGARYHLSRYHSALLGVMVDRRFGDQHAYPVLAYSWQPDAVTQVQLGFPRSAIQVNWSDEVKTYAKLEPAGGIWKEKPADSEALNTVKYKNWRLGMGTELLWRNDVWVQAELGYLARRSIDVAGIEAEPANTMYWQLGLNWRY